MEKTLPRDAYFDASFFERERRGIFFAEWFCAARSEELPVAGDYRAVSLAGQELLLVRGADGALRAFHNVCRHRGCELVDTAEDAQRSGRFGKRIRCPYHSWCYELDGRLQRTPHLSVDRERLSLHAVGLAEWAGFVFLRVDGGAASDGADLAAQLGPVPQRVRRYPLADLRCGWQRQYDVAANWKVVLENYNECYHCAGVHPELCRIVPAFRDRGGQDLDWEAGIPQREGTNTFTHSGTTARRPMPGLSEAERSRHFGELVYPNLLLSLAMDHAAAFLVWPVSPVHTRIDCRLLFHPQALAEPGFDPSDAADFWDLVNDQDWRICERVQRGMRALPFEHGWYAPMEDMSLDIRDYVASRIG